MPIEVAFLLVLVNTCITVVGLLAAQRLSNAVSRLVDQIDDVEELEL